MNKKLMVRRVAILLALVIGLLQVQLGGATTVTTYTGAGSFQQTRADLLGGGSLSTSGAASNAGILGATATAASDSTVADDGIGSRDQCLLTSMGSACSGRAIGANEARRTSVLKALFPALQTGTYTATITVSIAGISDPSAVFEPGGTADSCAVPPTGADNNAVFVCPYGTGAQAGSNYAVAGSAYGSTADASLALSVAAFAPRQTGDANGTNALGESQGYATVSKGIYGGGCVTASTVGTGDDDAGPTSSSGSCSQALAAGTITIVVSFSLASPGTGEVQVQLVAHAWAAGKNASGSTGGHLSVTSIEVA